MLRGLSYGLTFGVGAGTLEAQVNSCTSLSYVPRTMVGLQ